MKVCAGLSNKSPEKQSLPLSLAESSIRGDDDPEARRNEYEDRIEKGILCVLTVIVAICLIGTLTSVGGFLYLRHRAKTSEDQHVRQTFISRLRVPIKSELKMDSASSFTSMEIPKTIPTTTPPKVTTTTPTTTTPPPSPVTTTSSWFDDFISSSSNSRDDKDPQETPFSAIKKKLSWTPTFVTVRNQWTLEQPPSTKQLFAYVKQAFHFIRNNRYFTPTETDDLSVGNKKTLND